MSNRLKNEKSPYLLQHGENPVDWYPWCEEAFRKAISEDKPVFLSIGYSTCHWCHVMAHESFEDAEVAEVLNKNFICIKVDREERPDIDTVYMSACQAVTGAGGWPLTVIMTPQQKPFFVGTYFPKRSRYTQPGLIDILEKVTDLWRKERESLLNAGEEITEAIRHSATSAGKEVEKEILHKAYHLFQRQFDTYWGGFGQAPKFPSPHNLLFLMQYAFSEGASDALKMAEITLDAMAAGGIQDHIGGGFSRYSTDERWLVPHFEKMLYDNALLIMAYTEAWKVTGKERYAETVRRTADYLLRELWDEKGGFYCGQDADSDGVEGKYYVFTPAEIIEILGEKDGSKFCRSYGITETGNFEGKSIPNRISRMTEGWKEDDKRLKKLYEYRQKRTKLHKDDKILLSWNAWTIIALSKAGQALGEMRYLDAAEKAQRFIEEYMTDGDHRLYVRFRDEEAANSGQLEDYAVYVLALLELYQVTFDVRYLKNAVFGAQQMRTYFEDKEKGGYYMTAADAERLITRPKEVYDGAIPSGNSAAAMALQRLASLTGETKWIEAAERQIRFCAGEISEYPAGYSFALLSIAEVLYPHKELICATRNGIPKELAEYLRKFPAYGLNVLVKTEENEGKLAKYAPFTADYLIPEKGALYYLCENGVCKMPVTEFAKLDFRGEYM